MGLIGVSVRQRELCPGYVAARGDIAHHAIEADQPGEGLRADPDLLGEMPLEPTRRTRSRPRRGHRTEFYIKDPGGNTIGFAQFPASYK